jgi:predicted ATPase/DNA-binding SARP family transcriptional activator
MGRLELAWLGTPDVRHAGAAVTFPTRKALALLAYLAVEGGMHSREKLSALFWPESDAEHGRTALRKTLAFLRTALRDTGDPQPAPAAPHLIVAREALGLNTASDLDLDLQTLQTAWTLARTPAVRLEDEARGRLLDRLQAAVECYRGDFLEGFALSDAPAFDEWAGVQREVWRHRAQAVCERLAQLQSEAGEVQRAIDTVLRWLALDPLDEEAHRCLMQLHLRAGDRPAALRAYQACQAVLAAELGVEPAPETIALAERIRRAQAERTPGDQQPSPTHQAARSPGLVIARSPLVGRADEFGALVAAYHTACRGAPQVVTLEGEAGIGKTRLATEFLAWATAQGAEVLHGRAFETGGRLPYQPLVDALRARLERSKDAGRPHALLGLSDTWLAELSRLLPELRDQHPNLPGLAGAPEPGEEATARTRLFEAIARLGQALARQAPLLLFVDDLQWADAASLDVLHYAARRWAEIGTPVVLLLSLRTSAFGAHTALAAWLPALQRDVALTRLVLGPLTADATTQLVRALAGATANAERRIADPAIDRFGQWLYAETAGQPFYILETIKSLIERRVLGLRRGTHRPWVLDIAAGALDDISARSFLPPGIREVIRARLAQLAPAAFGLLAAGAVLGHGFTFEQLCRVAAIEEEAALPALDELLAGQLIRAAGDEVPGDRPVVAGGVRSAIQWPSVVRYGFTHDKIRDVVYTEAGDARRRVLHRRALDVVGMPGVPPAVLARHALAAGLAEPAFRHSMAAGDDALRLFAVSDAIAHYEQARQVLDWQTDPRAIPIAEQQHLYLQLGRAYELSGQAAGARAVYEALLALAQACYAPALECAALNHLATLAAQDVGDFDVSMALLQRALAAAERSGDQAGLADTEWNLAQISFYASNPEGALAHGERALALARDLGHQDLIARSLNVIAYAETSLDRWAAAEAHAEEARACYAALGNRAMEADCLTLIAHARIHRGQAQAGIAAARAANTISQEIANPWGQIHSAVRLAMGLLEAGAYAEALATAQQAAALARRHDIRPMLIAALIVLGTAQRALRDLQAARAAHLEAAEIDRAMPSQPFQASITVELCADAVQAGAWEEAHRYALQALELRDNNLMYASFVRWCVSEALLTAGDRARAAADSAHFGARSGDNPRYRLPYLRALAALARSADERGPAIAHLEAAAALAAELGLPGEQWQIALALGALHQACGEPEQAGRAFARAAALAQALASQLQDERLRAALQAAVTVESQSGGRAA